MRKRSKKVPKKNLKFIKSFFDFRNIDRSTIILTPVESDFNIKHFSFKTVHSYR